MAEAPNFRSATDAAAARYAPLSTLAVVSLAVGVLFAFVLLVLGWLAYKAGQPLLQLWLFVLPLGGVFLAFLARRQISNSEGARTGEVYANAGWWLCVVLGACYGAYLLANDLAVRADSEREVLKWADHLGKGKPADPADPAVWEAFKKSLDPGNPMLGNPQSVHQPGAALAYSQFRHNPLLLVWSRNRETAKFVPNGLKSWQLTPDGKMACEAAAVLSCPEGEFPVTIPLQAVTDPQSKVRAWQVMPNTRFQFVEMEQVSRTRYGWLLAGLEMEAIAAALEFCEILRFPAPIGHFLTTDRFITNGRSQAFTEGWMKTLNGRVMLTGPLGVFAPEIDPTALPAGADRPNFFSRLSGEPMTDTPFARPDGKRTENGLSTLRKVWQSPLASNLRPAVTAGFRMAEAAPRSAVIDTSDPARVLFKVHVDFQPPQSDFSANRQFVTGYLVMACDDPAVVKELRDAQQAAKDGRDRPTRQPVADLPKTTFRALRLETDLTPIALPQQPQPGGG
ncbi:MAG: hypothetical protein MUF18_07745 [Fimbriiglobus sp.]|jgi:hypothetical protein|nr:hypothetical protein [Fimbriiglobus sp.]